MTVASSSGSATCGYALDSHTVDLSDLLRIQAARGQSPQGARDIFGDGRPWFPLREKTLFATTIGLDLLSFFLETRQEGSQYPALQRSRRDEPGTALGDHHGTRTTGPLLQVKIEDVVEADSVFTVLMGDQVEPRREFIEKNALNVSNLDI